MDIGIDCNCKFISYEEFRKGVDNWLWSEHSIPAKSNIYLDVRMNGTGLVCDISEDGLTDSEIESLLYLFDGSTNTTFIINKYLEERWNIEYIKRIDDFEGFYFIY